MGHKSLDEGFLSEAGAHSLARKIREYWHCRGVQIDVRVEPGSHNKSEVVVDKSGGTKGPPFWVVRSNLNASFNPGPDPRKR